MASFQNGFQCSPLTNLQQALCVHSTVHRGGAALLSFTARENGAYSFEKHVSFSLFVLLWMSLRALLELELLEINIHLSVAVKQKWWFYDSWRQQDLSTASHCFTLVNTFTFMLPSQVKTDQQQWGETAPKHFKVLASS